MGNYQSIPVEPRGNKTIDEWVYHIANVLALTQEEVENFFGGRISSVNIRELIADKIQTGTLDAGKVTIRVDYNSGAYIEFGPNGMIVNDGTIKTVEVDTNGNATFRGKIRAGASIDVGTDARIGNNLYMNESDGSGSKGIVFSTVAGQTASISAQSGDLGIQAGGFVTFTIGSSQGLVVNQKVTAPIFNATTGLTINNESVPTVGELNAGLAGKANVFSGYSGSIPPGATLFVTNGVITGYT